MPIAIEEPINTYTVGNQVEPEIVVLADGGYVVMWQSSGQDGSGGGIYGQRFTSNGTPLGAEFRINDVVSGTQEQPRAAALSDGGFVVVWQDTGGADGSGYGVIGQRFAADGSTLGGNFVANTTTSSTQYAGAVAAYDGGYAVVWSSSQSGGNSFDIYVQRYTNAGTPVGAEDRVSTVPGAATAQPGAQYQPDVATLQDGRLIVVWNDSNGNDGNGDGVFGRLFDPATGAFGDTFLVNTTTAGSQSSSSAGYGPRVAALADGGFVAVWPANGQDGSGWGVFGQRFNADGSKAGGEFLVNQSTNGGQYQADVTALSTGGFVVTWYNDNYDVSGSGTSADVYVREFGGDGLPAGDQRKLLSATNSTEYQPAIADLGNGNYIVAYADYVSTANGGDNSYEIRQQIFGDEADFFRQANPELGDFTGSVTFAENLVNATPQVIDAAVSFHDVDSADFDGGVIDLFYTQYGETTDQLGVRHQGSAPGHIGVAGSTVTYGGVAIGTISGGQNGSNLSIALNANATAAAVEALIQNLTYASTSQSPAASRTVGIRVSDGDGGASASSQVTINVTLELDGAPEVHTAERINTYTGNQQYEPEIVVLADGSYVVVWQSGGQDGSGDGIYGQRFTSNGTPLGAEFRINDVVSGTQEQPRAAALSDGGFVVVWQDTGGADGSGYGVIGQRFAADGSALGGNFVANTTTSSTQYAGAVAAYDGGYAVVWSSSQSGGNSFDIYVQRYTNAGTPVGAEDRVSTVPGAATAQPGAQYQPDVATLQDGRLIVVWNDSNGNDGNGDGVFGRLFDPATGAFGDTFLVNTTTAGSQSSSSAGYGLRVAALADGGFVVVWPDNGQDGSGWGVFGQRFNADGSKAGGEFRINESTTSSQYQASVTALSTGGFVVAWHNDGYGVSGSGSYNDVYIREYDGAGVPVDGERKLTGPSSTGSNQVFQPAIADLGDGNFVVVYSAYQPTANGGNNTYEIFQNVFGDAAALARTSAAPVLTDLAATVSFGEVAASTAPQLIDAAVSLVDLDSTDFGGGRLDLFYVQYGEATDQLGVRHEGNGAGQIGVAGNTVSYGGIVIGTIAAGADGADGANLAVLFNAAATVDAVEALIQNLTYATTADKPGQTRTIGLRIADGDGGVSAARTVNINIALDLDTAAAVHGEERVNSYVESTQSEPEIVVLADGGYVVMWQSSGQDGSGDGIYGQRFTSNGTPLGAEFRINDAVSGMQEQPRAAALSDGGFVVVWQDTGGADGSGWGIIGQRFAADGSALGSNFVANTTTNGNQSGGAVAAYDGGYAVVWSSSQSGGSSFDIYVQRFTNAGTPAGGETRVSTVPGAATAQPGAQYQPDVAARAGGDLIVVWNDSGSNDGSGDGVFGRIYDSATGTFGSTFLVNTTTAGSQSSSSGGNGPHVATLVDGGFVVIWPANGQDGSGWGVFGQRFNADGSKAGGEFLVNQSTNGGQYQADVTALSTGGFVVTWYNDNYDVSGSGTTGDVYLREYGATGLPVDDERKLSSATNSTEYQPAVADLGNGNYVVVYADYGTSAGGGNGYDIRQQIFGDAADFVRNSAAPLIDDVRTLLTLTSDAASPLYAGNAQIIDGDVAVMDVDSADFAGGQLAVQLLNGASAGEALAIRHQGNGAGQIGVAGNTVSYGGTVIGTFSGGGSGAATLLVSLNANAGAAAVRALIENVSYQNSTPPTGTTDRYLAFRLFDGDGGVSDATTVQIRIQSSSPSLPALVLDDVETTLQIGESQAQAGVLIDGAVALDYNGSNGFDGGKLTVGYLSSTGRVDDQLGIRNQGSGAGEVGLSGSTVLYEGSVIGTVSAGLDGVNGAGLEIVFNGAATAQAIERVIENLVYSNTSDGPNPNRTIRINVRDAANVASGNSDVVIQIAPEADPAAPQFLLGQQQSNGYEAGDQGSPAVGRLFGANDGGYVIAWVSAGGQDGSGQGVFAQRYAADGSAIGPEFQVNSHTLNEQNQPTVAGLQNGGFVVVWASSNQDGSGYGVYAQRYGADGTPQSGEFQVNTSTSSTQDEPAVLGLADGSFVIAYSSYYNNTGGSYYDVLGQRYAADGTPLGGEFTLNTQVSNTQSQPRLAALEGGGFVAIWTDSSGDASGYGIVAQRFAADGSKLGGEIKVNTTETGNQQGPDVAGLPGGGFVAVWHYNSAVYAQRFDASGGKAGGELLVSTADTSSNYSNHARVAVVGDGFVVTWDSYYSLGGSGYDIVAQKFDFAGNKIDGTFLVNSTTDSTQYQPAIAALGGSNFVVAWAGYNQEQGGTASTYGVFHQLLGEAGSITRSAAPELLDLASSVTFGEALVNAAPQIIDPGVNLIDADSANFDGGSLWVSVVSGYGSITYAQLPEDVPAQDQLGIRHQGSGADQIGVAGNTVSYGGTVIGTILSAGANGADLVIRFNASATPTAVEKLIESLTYANTSSAPVASRSIAISVSDGAGGTSVPKIVTINVTPDADGAQPLFANERVNTFEPGTQDEAAIARLADGGYVVVWTSSGQDGWGDGVHGQRYDAKGVPVGSEFQVNSYTPNGQSAPAVAGLGDGGYVVLWQSSGQDGSSWGVFGQRFDASGVPAGGEFQVNTGAQNEQSAVAVAGLADGFVATWYSYYQDGTYQDVYFQRFDAAGNKLGAETRANTSAGYENSYQGTPAITAFADGSFVIVWRGDGGQDGSGYGVFGQRYAADGSALGAEFQVNSHGADNQYEPDVAVLADGGFVVVWRSDSQDGSGAGVFGQRYDASGNAVGAEFRVNTGTSGNQYQPSVSALSHGGFVVAWNDDSRTYAQQFDAAGARIDHPLRVDTLDNNSNANLPAVLGLDNGAFVTVWRDYDYGTGSHNVYQQLFGSPGDFAHSANPELVDVATSVVFRENLINTAPQLIDPSVGLFDADSADFDGGILEVDYLTGYGALDQLGLEGLDHQDQLGIRNQGAGTNEIGVSGTTVSFEGTIIGTIVSNGQNGAKLTVMFNANATSEAVERVIENLTYANTVSNPIASRTVSIRVTDGDGGASVARTVRIDVVAETDGAVPHGLEKTVNTTVANEQSAPAVAVLADGGYVVVWQSYGQDATSTWGVYGQRYDADDNPVGGEFRVNTTTAGGQYEAQVVGLAGGGYAVVWRSDGQDGSGAGVYGQRYAADGSAIGGEFRINTTTSSNQYQPSIAADADDGFVVAWYHDAYSAGNTEYADIFFQRYDAGGNPAGAETRANPSLGSTFIYQSQPDITWLDNGGFVVVWTDTSGTDGNGQGVFGQVFDASGNAVGGAFQANAYITGAQQNPAVAALKDGGFVVVWESEGQDLSSTGIYGQRFDAAGAKLGAEFRVNTTVSSTQYQPDVVGLENGGWVVTWTDAYGASSGGYDVFVQQYDAAGRAVDGETRVNNYTPSTQYEPAIAATPDGGFVVAYSGYTYSGDGNGDGVPDGGSDSYDIRLQRFSNTAPEITDVSVNGLEEAVIVLDYALFEAGFSDEDGQSLQAIRITTLPANGILRLDGVAIVPGQEIGLSALQGGLLTYQGETDFFGLDQFLWTGSDGVAFAATPVATNITLANVNDGPRLEAGANDTAAEGTWFYHTIAIGDPDPEGHRVTVSWGDGSPDTVFSTSSANPGISHVYADDGSYTVTVTVDDQQGQANSIETDSFDVAVANVAPTIAPFGGNSVVQGEVYTLGLGTPYDPGTDTVTEYRIDWGDGSDPQIIAAAELPPGGIVTHSYTAAGGKTIRVTLVDEDGVHSNAGTKSITVAAPAEVITVDAGNDVTVLEGSYFQKIISFDDPTDQGAAGRSYTVTWGDGQTTSGYVAAGQSSFVIGHTYADDAAGYEVTVTVDDDGQQGSDSFTVQVNNVAPTISLGGNPSVAEGSPYALTLFTPSDPGADTVQQYVIRWGDGSEQTIAAADLPADRIVTHVYADGDANQTIEVDLVDEDGTWVNAGSRGVHVYDVAPTLALAGAGSVDEGSPYTLELGAIADPGLDTVTQYRIDWGDGTVENFTAAEIAAQSARTHVYQDGGAGGTDYTISVALVDEDGTHANAGSKTLTVANVAPVLALSGADDIDEGGSYVLAIAATDPAGAADPLSYTIDWGDGSAVQTLTAAELAALGGNVAHVFADDEDGPVNATARSIVVTVSDGDGGSHSLAKAVTVHNVAPTVALGGAGSVDEGSPYTLELGAIVDPGLDTVTQYRIDWGDGTVENFTAAEIAAQSARTHVYQDGGTGGTDYAISVALVDEDGTHANAGSKTITVANVAPVLALSGADDIDEGGSYLLAIAATDPAGAADPLSYTIDWGDGSAVQTLTAAELAALGGNVAHVFADDEDGPVNATARTITVTASDGDGGVAQQSRSVTVHNVAPTLALSGAAGQVQGTAYALTLGAVSDPGLDTVTAYVVDWGDGTVGVFDSAGEVTHTYAGTGDYTISVSLADEDGTHAGVATRTVSITAPTATLSFEAGADASIDEGETFTRNIVFSDGEDNGAAGWSYSIDYGDGTVVTGTTPVRSIELSHRYADGDATRTVTVTLTDEAGESVSDSFDVTVANVAPTVALSGAGSVDEGSAYVLSFGALVDPGADTATAYTLDWGDGTVQSFTAAEFAALGGNASHVYADDGSYGITLGVTDEDGSFIAGSKTVAVANVAPVLALSGADDIDEGGSYLLAIAATDPAGAADPLSYTIDWGDGSAVQTLTAAELAALGGNVAHVFADDEDGPVNATARSIVVTVSDGDGGSHSLAKAVTVHNVAPTVALGGAGSVDEGSAYVLNFGALVDPGADTATAYTLDWGDGTVQSFTAAEFAALGGNASHTYADDGNYGITLSVTDEDGSFVAGSKSVTVANVAPVLALSGADDIDEGGSYLLAIAATDPAGAADPLSYTIDWGDGSAVQTLTAAELAALGGNVAHVFADDEDGPVNATARTITVTASDGDGGVAQQSRSVTVHNVAPTLALSGAAGQVQGTAYALTLGAVSDPGLDTVTAYVVDWGDGTVGVFDSAGEVTHTYAGTGDYTISVSLADEDGTHAGVATRTVSITAPTATLSFEAGADAAIDEGETFTRSIVFSDGEDNGAAGWSYSIDYGDGTVVTGTTPVRSIELSHRYADGDATRTVTVTLTDEAGESVSDSFDVTVANVAPTVALSGAGSVDEGSAYVLSFGALVDPGADTATAYTLDWGDGTVQSFTAAEFAALGGNASHVYADDGSYGITLGVTDEDGSFIAGSKTVTVANVAPVLALSGADDIDEGGSYVLAIAATDPAGAADPLSYTIDWGDGSAVQTLTAAELAALGGNVAHVFADDEDGPVNATARSIVVTVSDGDGGSHSLAKAVTVHNVAPTVALGGAGSVDEGSAYVLNFGALVDPGADTVTAYTLDWGDGTVQSFTATEFAALGGNASHTYADDGNYGITLSVTDE
ncbi:PKD domain-containing protein, partial [Thauera sinica]